MCHSKMKSLTAILEGSVKCVEITLRCAFFFDDCWNVMNDQDKTD